MDIAKRLLDYGFHAPTVYFPLIVPEAMMIEPTETESKETLDAFADALLKIHGEDPELLHEAPHTHADQPARRGQGGARSRCCGGKQSNRIRNPKSEIRNPKSEIRNMEFGFREIVAVSHCRWGLADGGG